MNFLSKLTPTVRAYIYRVLLAAGAVGVFYGLISSEELAIWGGLIVVVLNILPTANTSVVAEKQLDQGLAQVESATVKIIDKGGDLPSGLDSDGHGRG